MESKPISVLYRSFLVDFLTRKGVTVVAGAKRQKRNVKSQKIKYLEREYKLLYSSNPKNDFIPLKDNYNNYDQRKKEEKPNFFDKYLHINWRKKRIQVFTRDKRTCKVCESNKNLQCHHQYYIDGRELWEYPLDCFLTLCRTCHENYHEKVKGSSLVIKDPFKLKEKIAHEKTRGFSLRRNIKPIKNIPKTKTKKPIVKTKQFILSDKEETLEQRRKRLVVPQWKIDEYRANLAKQKQNLT